MSGTVSQAVEKASEGPVKIMWSKRAHFSAIAPAHVDVEAFLGTAAAALYGSADLMKAATTSPDSLITAMLECASLGHLPGTPDYYLTPWKTGGRLRILGIEGYRGVIERMYRSGGVASVHVREVCAGDAFRYVEGQDDRPYHEVGGRGQTGADFFGVKGNRERGEMVGVYAYARLTTGAWSRVVLLDRNDVMAAKAVNKGSDGDYSPWQRLDAGPDHPELRGRSMWWKGLALDTPIPTPSGWTTMGAIRPGDQVLDRNGQPTAVVGVSETKHLDCYRVHFRSGPPIVCDAEHLWVARVKRELEKVHPIADLYEAKQAGKPVLIPVAGAMELPDAQLTVDPWVLGYWLGNGSRDKGRVTAHADDADEVSAAIASAGYEVGAVRPDPRSRATDIGIRGLVKQLADLGVLGHKMVPSVYRRGSADQRLALLRGLMDSDGSAEASRGRVRFSSSQSELRDAVAELARSLGEQVLTFDHDATGYGKTVRAYEASWTPSVMPFALSRKANAARLRTVRRDHSVVRIERIESVPTRCIAVDSSTHTFLAGTAMVPTHNTAAKRLEPWVPTSAEYRREMLRASAKAADLRRTSAPPPPPADDVQDAELVDEPADPGADSPTHYSPEEIQEMS